MSTKVSKRKASQFEETVSLNERAKEKQAKTSCDDVELAADHDANQSSINHHNSSPLFESPDISSSNHDSSDPFTPPMKPIRLTNPPASIESVAVPSMAALTLANHTSAPPSPGSATKAANVSPASSAIRARDSRDATADPRSMKRSRAAIKLSTAFSDTPCDIKSSNQSQHHTDQGTHNQDQNNSPCPHATAAVDSACLQMRQITISSLNLASVPTSSSSQSILQPVEQLGHKIPASGLETMHHSLGVSLNESASQIDSHAAVETSCEIDNHIAVSSTVPTSALSEVDSDCDEVPQLPVIPRRLGDLYVERFADDLSADFASESQKARHSIYENEPLDDDVSSVQSITSTQISVETASSSLAQSVGQAAIRCEICNKDLSGVAQYESHILGRKHVHAALMAASGGQFRCHLCNKVFTCVDDREKHMMSEKHKRNVQLSMNPAATSPRSNTTDDSAHSKPSRSRRTMSSNSISPDDVVTGISKKRKFGRSSPSGSLASAASPTPQFKSSKDHSGNHSSHSQHSIRYLTPVETCADGSVPMVRLHARSSEGDRSSSNSPIPVSRVSSGGRSSVDPSILRSPERLPPSHMPQPMFTPHSQFASHPNQYSMQSALPFTMGPSAAYAFLSPAALAALSGPIMPSLTPITVLYPTEMIMNQSPMMPYQFSPQGFWPQPNHTPPFNQFYPHMHQPISSQQDGYQHCEQVPLSSSQPFTMPVTSNQPHEPVCEQSSILVENQNTKPQQHNDQQREET